MRYFKTYNENNKLIVVGTGDGGIEITETEYNALILEIDEKAIFEEQLYQEEVSIDDIPTEWQYEIQCRVNKRIELENTIKEQQISSDEFYSMIEGVL